MSDSSMTSKVLLFCYVNNYVNKRIDIFFVYIQKYSYLCWNQKQKTMYQVHIFRGMDRECISCDSLQNANSTIIDIASHNGWNYKYDQDGFAYAHAGDNHYININAFIFQII